eukprot:TRINITY_DN16216_c0_g1_i3.p1 TRINITY_DN16216_c0_g1~~TRINITY_DN16216_c0_g1_i3.p1  ORF type:complete len:308 (+),score=7.22 TRINITY_DN16216_c0_g1_i3:522-1445(+)
MAFEEPHAVILHATALKFEELVGLINQVKACIRNRIEVKEIRVELKYTNKEGKFVIYEDLRGAYCEGNGFKWRTILNSSTKGNDRTLILGLTRHKEYSNTGNLCSIKSESIQLRHCSILNFSNTISPSVEYESPMYAACSLVEGIGQVILGEELLSTVNTGSYVKTAVQALDVLKSKEKIDSCATSGLFAINDFSKLKSFVEEYGFDCEKVLPADSQVNYGLIIAFMRNTRPVSELDWLQPNSPQLLRLHKDSGCLVCRERNRQLLNSGCKNSQSFHWSCHSHPQDSGKVYKCRDLAQRKGRISESQ